MSVHCPAEGKSKYDTYAEALGKLDSRYDLVTGLSSLSGSVYPCDFCGGFHVSSKKFTLQKPRGRGKRRRGLVKRAA
jgi:hypothetical protein